MSVFFILCEYMYFFIDQKEFHPITAAEISDLATRDNSAMN